MSEANNSERVDNTEIESKNEYQPTEDIMSLIKEQTSGITIKNDDIKNLTKILKEWNDCYLSKGEPKKELEEIKIDDFTLSYEEFKSLLDNGLLSNQYYSDKYTRDLDIQEVNLDRMMPSMSKDGIFNMMNYNLAKHSSISNEVELHYASNNRGQALKSFKNLNDNIIEESKTDGKVHFVLTDITAKTKTGVNSGHVTPYIIVNGEMFEFDSISNGLGSMGNGYAMKYSQQVDYTSCKTIAVREVDNFLKILENFDSIEEFSSYLKQFFSENKIEYYIDPDKLDGDLIEGPKTSRDTEKAIKNRRLAILPLPILKNSQSLSSLNTILEFIQNKEKKYKKFSFIFENNKEEFIKKYKHIIEMRDKLEKLVNRFKVKKKVSTDKTADINAYTLKERLRQAKVLAILLENGLTKSLEDIGEYKNTEKGKAALATVDKEWVRKIDNKTKDNIENRKIRILENDRLKKEREKTKSTIAYKIRNFFSKIFSGEETNYESEQEALLKKEILINKIFREQFYTPTIITEQQISNQNELKQQNIRNELDNKKENEIKEQGV